MAHPPQLSVADVYFAAGNVALTGYGLPIDLAPYPKLTKLRDHVLALPQIVAWRDAHKKEE